MDGAGVVEGERDGLLARGAVARDRAGVAPVATLIEELEHERVALVGRVARDAARQDQLDVEPVAQARVQGARRQDRVAPQAQRVVGRSGEGGLGGGSGSVPCTRAAASTKREISKCKAARSMTITHSNIQQTRFSRN